MAGSGVDFRGEDLEETMESQLEPTGETYLGCTTAVTTRWRRSLLTI